MSEVVDGKPVDFDQVFKDEIAAVNFRRAKMSDGTVAQMRRTAAADRAPLRGAAPGPIAPDRAYAVNRGDAHVVGATGAGANTQISAESNLTGLALSGGGIRSASFSLGVLQALDSLAENDQPQVIDALDYISTVSGGGYIGTSLVAGMMDGDHSFPFTSRLDSEETPEIQHLRDFSSFLAPNGFIDLITGLAYIVRGLLINALIVLPFLLLLAALTIGSNQTIASLTDPDVLGFSVAGWPLPRVPGFPGFTLTASIALLAMIVLFVSAFFFNVGKLRTREWFGRGLAYALIAVAVVAVFEAQPFVLKSLVCVQQAEHRAYGGCRPPAAADGADTLAADQSSTATDTATGPATAAAPAVDLSAAADAAGDGPLAALLGAIGWLVPQISVVLGPVALLLISFGQKLANVARATVGDDRWQTWLARHGSRITLGIAAVVVPLVLWIIYLYLSLWAVTNPWAQGFWLRCGAFTPPWLQFLTSCSRSPVAGLLGGNPVADVYALAGALMLLIWLLLLGPNVNTLHRYYRDRLSRAFLLERDRLHRNHTGRMSPTRVDGKTFGSLKPVLDPLQPISKDGFDDSAALAPYLLVNAAINIDGSEKLNRRGRNADTFLFSPLYVGSRCTRYAREPDLRVQVPDLTLGTAMAISGAAASANMGRMTIRPLIFSLALLNVRLGYWLANPNRLQAFKRRINGWRSNVGLWYFGREALGTLDERGLQVYLTDGGHVENLGVYELLRRRCKVIVAVDVDLDPLMNFPSLVSLEMMARIDLGARIEVPWRDLQTIGTAVKDDALHGSPDNADYPDGHGPHAAVGIVRYDDDKVGVLIHIKTMLSGDENDYILDYKRRNASFPHETTIDQFYSEEQFEVYRALGFHATRRLFTGDEPAAHLVAPVKGWTGEVESALRLLNIPEGMIAKVVGRMKDDPTADVEVGDPDAPRNGGAAAAPAAQIPGAAPPAAAGETPVQPITATRPRGRRKPSADEK